MSTETEQWPNGWPTKEDYQCEWEDHFSDMYPEFAPEPIRVKCKADAEYLFVSWDPHYPPVTQRLCGMHAVITKFDDDYPPQPPQVQVWLGKDGTHGTW